MSISLKKSGMLKLGLSLVAMTVAASVQAKTLVYCSEGSPEGFNPQLFTSGTTYDASSVPIYNRLNDQRRETVRENINEHLAHRAGARYAGGGHVVTVDLHQHRGARETHIVRERHEG